MSSWRIKVFIEAFAAIVHRDKAEGYGRALAGRLKDVIPNQLFVVAIQACIGGKNHRPRIHIRHAQERHRQVLGRRYLA